MKILKLEFRNINSLKGSHEIDFSRAPFTGSSLFAITGPTGSGKSTILDVISLALFNRIPRLDKVSKSEIQKTGAIITRNQKDAMAAVTYEGRGGCFRSEWSISTARTGSLREYTMELSHRESGELLPLKKSEVPDKNEELIGLNYNQFIKSVLLAQGEFAQFLKAKKEERGELLEKITGTGIYRQLGRMAWEKHKTANADILHQQQAIALLRPKLLEPDREKEIATSLKEKDALSKPLEETLEKLKRQLELKDKLKKRKLEIEQREQEKKKAEAALELFNKEQGQLVQQHEKVRPYSEELRHWSRLREERLELNKEKEIRQLEEEQNLLDIQKCLENTGKFTREEISAVNIMQKLAEFREKVSSLEESRRLKLEWHNNVKSRLEATLNELEFDWQQEPEARLSRLEELMLGSEGKLNRFRERLQVDLGNLPEEKKQLQLKFDRSRKAQLEWVQIEQLADEILRLKTDASGIAVQKKELPKKKELLQHQVESSRLTLDNLQLKKENQLLVASMEEHRQKLKQGEPCHLCGSLEHPYAEGHPQTEHSLEVLLKEAGEKYRQLNHQLSSVITTLEGVEKRFDEISTLIQEKEKSLQSRQDDFSKLYSTLKVNEETGWEQLCDELELQLKELEACEQEQRVYKAVSTALPLHRDLNKVLAEGKALKLELDALYTGKDIHMDCQKFQNDWLKFSQLQANLKKQQQDLDAKLQDKTKIFKDVEQKLKQELSELQLEAIETARKMLLPEPQFQQLHSQREQLNSRISEQLTTLNLLRSQLEKDANEESKETKEELLDSLGTRSLQLKTIKQDCEDLRRLLRNDADYHKELEVLQSSIAQQEVKIRRWRLLNELIGDAVGKKFNDFAQDLSSSQLIHLANLRLRDLSDRYRIDKPTVQEDDGLIAIDDHMGGQRRSVKTLSGGETFLLSLSMALALSDLASKNVEINSLFIDEGFGTLDPETLDQTLDTLEKLQAESSKTIGIISHVDSLKERIATQVQLKRNGQGYSQLSVMGVEN